MIKMDCVWSSPLQSLQNHPTPPKNRLRESLVWKVEEASSKLCYNDATHGSCVGDGT